MLPPTMRWEAEGRGERDVGRVLSQPPFAFPQPQSPTTSCSETLLPTLLFFKPTLKPPLTPEHDVRKVAVSVCLYVYHRSSNSQTLAFEAYRADLLRNRTLLSQRDELPT